MRHRVEGVFRGTAGLFEIHADSIEGARRKAEEAGIDVSAVTPDDQMPVDLDPGRQGAGELRYHRSPSSAGAVVLCLLLLLAGGGLTGYSLQTYTIDQLLGNDAAAVCAALAVASAVAGAGGLLWTLSNRAAGVALVVDW